MPDQPMAWIEAALAECPRREFQERLREELERRIHMTATSTITGVRQGFTTVTPYLTVVDPERFVQFVKDVFDAVETGRSTGASGHLHCEVRIGDSMLMCGGGEFVRGTRTAPGAARLPDGHGRCLPAGARRRGRIARDSG